MADSSATILLQTIRDNVSEIAKIPGSVPISKEIKYIDKVTDQIIHQTPWVVLKLGMGLLLIMLGWMISGWIASRLTRWFLRARMEETLANFLGSITRFMLFFNIFVVGLTVIGVSATSLAALLGAMGIAVGFAMRNTLGSIAGGVMLMVHRPMKTGDYIEITNPNGSPAGTVKRIGMFATEINTRDHVRVFIPNSILWESVLRNDTYNRMRMVHIEFGVSHKENIRDAFNVVRGVLTANPLVLKNPEPNLAIEKLNEAGAMCIAEVWCRTEDRRAIKETLIIEIIEAFAKAGMQMAYPDEKKAPEEAKPLGKQPGKRVTVKNKQKAR
ncbi:MAG: mechanosensitive ion channel family protein [Alphaproteobacteria bacterium]|nr:MAG: mechanosensitive ion channel family protein [Alphaproteobacteria bacterium]